MKSLVLAATLVAFTGPLVAPAPANAQSEPAGSASALDARLTLPRPKAGRTRPLVVVVAENAGAETTDFIIPYGVLKDSGVADVRSLSTGDGPVQLLRAIRIRADQTLSQFDVAEPAGADIVIVPAQKNPNDPVLTVWIRSQADRGAIIVSVCEGARVVAHAGLLNGRRATTHWSALNEFDKAYPATDWVRDRRYVQDGPIISTTGVTAAIPMSLALVEAIGGRDTANATAGRLGMNSWNASHRTADFHLGRADFMRAVATVLAFWTHETIELPVIDGQDEVSLALQSDVWSRSYRSRVVMTNADRTEVVSEHGLVILPDSSPRAGRFVIPAEQGSTVVRIGHAMDRLGRRYGPAARRFAVIGLEYDTPTEARQDAP